MSVVTIHVFSGSARGVIAQGIAEGAVSASRGAGLRARLSVVLAACREAWRQHRSRTYLLDLDDRALKDIGLSRAQAEFEARKWFWEFDRS